MRSVELTFNESADQQIRTDWDTLLELGVRSLATHASPSNSPHITLAAGTGLGIGPGAQELWERLPIDIRFSGLVIFDAGRGKFVLARLVVMSRSLVELHAALHRHITGAFATTLPNAWTPHVTLVRRLPGDQLSTAVAALDRKIEGYCPEARLWDSSTKTITSLTTRESSSR